MSLEQIQKEGETIEKFAEIEHNRWAKWQKYLHSLCTIELKEGTFEETGRLIIEAEKVKHWERQINTPYYMLSEKEKESDREQVRPYLDFINSRTTLAYQAGEKAMLEKLLKIVADTLDCDEKLSTKE